MALEGGSEKAIRVIAALGGPILDQQDIEAANDLAAGRILLEWLASQLPIVDNALDAEKICDRSARVALRDVALEKDEALILKKFALSDVSPQHDEDTPSPLDGYMPPSRLKKHVEFVEEETNLLQQEADLLKSRILIIKETSQKLTQSIKTLQRVVFDLDTKTRKAEERISDLSFNADTALVSTSKEALHVLETFGYSGSRLPCTALESLSQENTPKKKSDLERARDLLLEKKNDLSKATSNLRENMEALSVLQKQEKLKVEDLKREASRLQRAFQSIKDEGAQMSDIDKELLKICSALEEEASREVQSKPPNDILDDVLSKYKAAEEKDMFDGLDKLDVGEILRDAWAQDQASALKLERAILDEALSSLTSVVDPLESLHSAMSGLASCVQEAEVILEAFGEELGEIKLNQQSDDDESEGSQYRALEDVEMERELKGVLNEHQDLRPSDAPHLLLLTQEDILAELRALRTRMSDLEAAETQLVEELTQQYSARPMHPALARVYANSTLNDTAPFAFPAEVRDLETRARKTAAELQLLASTLEDEAREMVSKGSHSKRLDTFIEKWI